jgi:chorismate synthase
VAGPGNGRLLLRLLAGRKSQYTGSRAALRRSRSPTEIARSKPESPFRLRHVTLTLTTAGESHGPALVGIVSGLPAGLVLDRAAIEDDLRRRQQGYGRSPRQQIETDTIEVLAGLRHGRTLGSPLAFIVRNRDHANWEWGMNPWPPEGEPNGKGREPVTLPRPGHADLSGVMKFDLDDARDALERASARHTAVIVAGGSVGKALLRELGIEVAGSVLGDDLEDRVDAARAERDTVGGVVEVRARGVPPGLGSYATKEERLDARLAWTLMGTQAVKGVEIGDGFALAGLRGSEAHDEILRDKGGYRREANRAGGLEAGVSNGEEIVVRAAMKPLPTLMRPLRSADLETGEPAQALVERSDVAAVEALAVVAEACVAFELARAAREKFGGDSVGDFVAAWRAYLERIPWSAR